MMAMVEIRAGLSRDSAGREPSEPLGAESWADARRGDRGARISWRAPLGGADVEALARCTRDDGAWQALPKLGEARRSSVARLRLPAGPVVVKRYSGPSPVPLLPVP